MTDSRELVRGGSEQPFPNIKGGGWAVTNGSEMAPQAVEIARNGLASGNPLVRAALAKDN
jgi:hypothetical protein